MKTCKIKVNTGYKFDHNCMDTTSVDRLYTIFERAFNANDPQWVKYQERLRNHSICFKEVTFTHCSKIEDKFKYGKCIGPTREELLQELTRFYDSREMIDNQIKAYKTMNDLL